MDKVKSKVIALLMVIPLLLILTTSSVVKVTEIIADVPVESIKILGERTLEIAIDRKNDQGDYDNAYAIQTVITPENATNKNVRYEQTAVAGKTKADVLISADGIVRPLGTGTVKIVAIAGTHTASITITYTSDTVYSFSSEEEQVTISEGGEIALGDFCSMQPLDVQLDIDSFEVANSLKAEFSQASLKLKGKCRGETSFTINVNGIKIDSQTGAVSDTTYMSEIGVIVGATNTDSGISFAGAETIKCATTDTYTTEFGYSEKFGTMEEEALTYVCVDENGEESDAIGSVNFEVNGEETTVKVTITLSENAVEGKEYTLKVKRDGEEIATMTVVKADVVASDVRITVEKEWYSVGIQRVEFGVDLGNTSNASGNITYTFSSSNSNVVKFKPNSNKADMCAEGESVVSVTLKKNGKDLDIEVTPIRIHVVDSYKAFYFGDMDDTEGGLKSELAVARLHAIKNEGGSVTGKQEEKYQFMLSGKLSSAAKSEGSFKEVDCDADSEKMVWRTSDENIATVSNGKLTVKGNGEVKITVESAYNGKLKLKEPVNASITVNCRYDALEVDDYATLMYASENKLESVLTSDVMLAPNLIEELRANPASDVSKYYKTMKTTADYSYYKDNNIASEAVVKYCVEFTKSVYGNGHSINAQNITRNGLKTIFNGPLDIVRLKVNKGDANAAVKAQDNIVFLVKNDNITISNVELKGCSDSSLRDEGKDGINLSNLDYCGTVLEVIGNGLNLEYSKVNNGRTVVRIYGRAWNEDKYGYSLILPPATVEAERIKANISNCILERGREFILKIGTNQALKTKPDSGNIQQLAANAYENAAPALKKSDGMNYAVGEKYDDYFYNNYVLTDVTLKNSVLATSGLFAVGLESKFAGVCLHGYDYSDTYKFSELGWSRVAGTSYPAVLRLEGDVRFYDWKNIEDVNSKTLIEGDEATIGKIIKIDFAELLGEYNSGLDEKSKLITVTENKSYVNGAIAFYGGGKNYSYVDTTGTSEAFNQLASYTVGIDTLESKVVTYAAGVEPFRFMMYNKRTGNDSSTVGVGISYKEQVNAMADNTAYSWVRRDPSKDEQ